MGTINWRRGLTRLWLVLAIIWVGLVVWIMRPDKDAQSYWTLRGLDETYIADEVRVDPERCTRADGSVMDACMEAERRRAAMNRDFMNEALARKNDSLSNMRLAAILVVGPVLGALLLGFVLAWVARGFSSRPDT